MIRGNVQLKNVGYRVYCKVCEKVGILVEMNGETGRCTRIRCGEHYRDYQKEEYGSNLFDHLMKVHGIDKKIEFGFEVVRK